MTLNDPTYLVARAQDVITVATASGSLPAAGRSRHCFVFAFDVFCARCDVTVPAYTPHRCAIVTAIAAPP